MIANKYRVGELIGSGKFGKVFHGTHKNGSSVAIKMESADSPYKSVKHEATILNYLFQCGCRCVPSVMYYGLHLNQPCLVMDQYEMSLDDYMRSSPRSQKQIHSIMIRAIEILSEVHSYQIIHRDIKPTNFMLRDNQLFLIDFGMAISAPGEMNDRVVREYIIGTPKYVSCNVHDGIDPGFRDDMISLGYCYMGFLSGGILPWSQINATTIQSTYSATHILYPLNQIRKQMKSSMVNNIPEYFKECYNTPPCAMPNYDALSLVFSSMNMA